MKNAHIFHINELNHPLVSSQSHRWALSSTDILASYKKNKVEEKNPVQSTGNNMTLFLETTIISNKLSKPRIFNIFNG